VAERRLKRPRDPIQLGKLIVDIATGQVEDRVKDSRDPAAVELGKKGAGHGQKSYLPKSAPQLPAARLIVGGAAPLNAT
jgi:hypothetical protein